MSNEQDFIFPETTKSVVKKFVNEGPGERKEMDATKEIISGFLCYCLRVFVKKYYLLRVIFKF